MNPGEPIGRLSIVKVDSSGVWVPAVDPSLHTNDVSLSHADSLRTTFH